MTEFKLWFAYYDSLFMQTTPRLTQRFYEDHYIAEAAWPNSVCASLSHAFVLLEEYLKDPRTWVQSQCKIEELESIENDVDELIHFLNIEKSYAFLFWSKDDRRIEASLVHFYCLLQNFIRTLIPGPNMTLFECKSAEKLCVELGRLERLMNEILKCVNPIAKFLSSPRFAQQSKIIANFFSNWVCFMKKLPNIRKPRLNHVHNLAKFINLTNPIEICALGRDTDQHEGIRKKSNTVGTNSKQNANLLLSYPANFIIEQMPQAKPRKRSSSCLQLQADCGTEEDAVDGKKQKLFRLPKEVIQFSQIQEIKKKTSYDSFTSLHNKISEIYNTSTLATATTPRPSCQNLDPSANKVVRRREKAKSIFQTRHNTKSTVKRPSNNTIDIKETFKTKKATFYDRQCERNSQQMTVRSSKQSTIRKREISIYANYEQAMHRKNEPLELYYHEVPKFSIEEGRARLSKWGLVRAYVQSRIRLRRLEKILNQ